MSKTPFFGRFDPCPALGTALSPAVERGLKGVLDSNGQGDSDWLLADFSCHTLGVWHRVYQHSLELGPYEASKKEAVAKLAWELSLRLPTGVYGYRVARDCQALSGAELAECLIRLHRLDEAQTVLQDAKRAASQGSGQAAVLAPLVMSRALSDRSRHRPESAQHLFEQAAELFRRIPDPVLQGAALIRRGVELEALGRLEVAHQDLLLGLRLCRDPKFQWLQRRGAQALVRLIQRRDSAAVDGS